MSADLSNLLNPANIFPGIGEMIYLAPLSWFADGGIKKPAAGSVIIEEDYIFRLGKGFFKIIIAPRKNQLTAKTTGEVGFQKFEPLLEVFIPGSYAEQHEQLRALLNVPLIALCFDDDCPVEYYYALGCECEPCYLTCDFSTGYTHEGNKGYTARLTTTSKGVYFYEGIITVAEELFLITEDGQFITMEDDTSHKISIE